MATIVLVLGASGSGKSRSIKNFLPDEVAVIKGVNKPLPFKNNGIKSVFTNSYADILKYVSCSKAKSIILDDFGYNMTTEFMYSKTTGYDKFTNIAKNVYDLINYCMNVLDPKKIVYFVMHEEVDLNAETVKPKTIGKLLDEKVCVEGLFTIVLRCVNNGGLHQFYTNNNGCAKSPEGMFESESIENDLKVVDAAIRDYYGLELEEVK